ncbi:uncharacterized protein RB166_012923 [Leptodactylus fuscus]|uniref:uncharacterized protein LOC142209061 n=1 Tax=Leptodactylus fuscus TaxID=238119 RepID=UPI003F4E77A0
MERPVCLIENHEDGTIQVNQAALEILSAITQKVVVVAIVGKYRTGKSYLMNKLAGQKNGFSLGSTVQSMTKGIWMWCVPHPVTPDHTLVLLDTEGLGDVEKGNSENDSWIFALAVLLSSTLVFNSVGTIDQQAMEQLQYVTNLTEKIKVKSPKQEEDFEDDSSEFKRFFPSFVWCVRDFNLKLQLDGKEITEDEYLKNALKLKPGTSRTIANYNLPRECIRNYFNSHKCFVFERPASTNDLQNLDNVEESQLDPRFIEQTKKFCKYIYENSQVKSLSGGYTITGRGLGDVTVSYVESIRSGSIPSLENAVVALAKIENSRAKEEALSKYEEMMNQRGSKFPTQTHEEFLHLDKECHSQALKVFMDLSFKDENQEFQNKLQEALGHKKTYYMLKNEEASERKCRTLLEELSVGLEEGISDGKFYVPGGYKMYIEEKKSLEENYLKAKGKGVKALEVWQKFLKEKEGIESAILAADKTLEENEKKLAEQRSRAEAAARDKEILEKDKMELRKNLENEKESYKTNVKTLEKKLTEESNKMKEETERLKKEKLKALQDLRETLKEKEMKESAILAMNKTLEEKDKKLSEQRSRAEAAARDKEILEKDKMELRKNLENEKESYKINLETLEKKMGEEANKMKEENERLEKEKLKALQDLRETLKEKEMKESAILAMNKTLEEKDKKLSEQRSRAEAAARDKEILEKDKMELRKKLENKKESYKINLETLEKKMGEETNKMKEENERLKKEKLKDLREILKEKEMKESAILAMNKTLEEKDKKLSEQRSRAEAAARDKEILEKDKMELRKNLENEKESYKINLETLEKKMGEEANKMKEENERLKKEKLKDLREILKEKEMKESAILAMNKTLEEKDKKLSEQRSRAEAAARDKEILEKDKMELRKKLENEKESYKINLETLEKKMNKETNKMKEENERLIKENLKEKVSMTEEFHGRAQKMIEEITQLKDQNNRLTKKFCEYLHEKSPGLGDVAVSYVESIRSGSIPSMKNAVVALSKIENSRAIEEALSKYEEMMNQHEFPTKTEEFLYLDLRCHTQALKVFRKLSFKDENQEYQNKLVEMLKCRKDENIRKNEEASERKSAEQILQCRRLVFPDQNEGTESIFVFHKPQMEKETGSPVMERPVCFIENHEDGTIQVNQAALEILSAITQKVVVVAIVGKYRTGKSYLMNKLARRKYGFSLAATVQSMTKGIWMWCVPHPVRPDHTLVLLDTEGLGDVEKGNSQNDSWIFALAVLLSSTLVYNSMGTIDQQAMEQLHYVTKLTNVITINKAEDLEENLSQFRRYFPAFIWCVQDFCLQLEKNGKKITEDEYLKDALQLRAGSFLDVFINHLLRPEVRAYDLPRDCIRWFFHSHKCFVFDRPESKTDLQKLYHMQEPGFVQQTRKFCSYIYENSPVKSLPGGYTMTGKGLGDVAVSYVESLRSHSRLSIENAVLVLSQNENSRAVEEALSKYEEMMKKHENNFPQEEFLSLDKEYHSQALKVFMKLSFKDNNQEFQWKLKEELIKKKALYIKRSLEVSERECRAVLQELSAGLQTRTRRGSFSVPGGYKRFIEENKSVEVAYLKAKGKGVKSLEVLQEFLTKQQMILLSLLSIDKSLTEEEKELAELRYRAEAAARDKEIQEKKDEALEKNQENEQEVSGIHLKMLLKKVREEREKLKKENKWLIEEMLKEQQELQAAGFRRRWLMLDKEIARLRENNNAISEIIFKEVLAAFLNRKK